MAKMVLAGVQPSELPLMSFSLMKACAAEQRRERRAMRRRQARGGNTWHRKSIPTPDDPDGPPDREHFIAYGVVAGMTREQAEAEYERQLKNGGY